LEEFVNLRQGFLDLGFLDFDLGYEKFYKDFITVSFMKRVVGYGISVGGIVLMVLGFGIVEYDLSFLGSFGAYVSWVGVGAVVVGVVLSLRSEGSGSRKGKGHRVSGSEDEVPIYSGTGKKRKVVGYRKD
jgi:hypothetical protein